MFTKFRNMSVAARIYSGFAAIVGLLAVVGTIAFFGVTTLSDTFNGYRAAARQSLELGDYIYDIYDARISSLEYRLNRTPENAEDVRVWIDDVATYDPEGLAMFESNPDALAVIEESMSDANAYMEAFNALQAAEEQRTQAAAALGQTGEELSSQLEGIVETASNSGNLEVALSASRALQQIMQFQLAGSQFLQSGDEAQYQEAMSHGERAQQLLSDLESSIFTPQLSTEVATATELAGTYMTQGQQLHDAVVTRNTIESERIDPVGPKMQADFKGLVDSVKATQGTLGPAGARVASTTEWMVVGAVVVALLAGIGLAIFTGRWLSRAISSMAGTMRKLADGDLDQELSGSDVRHELGQMAQALEVFRDNGKAMREMDQQKEAEREREAAERRNRDAMQAEVGRVVAAAAEGDFSARITDTYDNEELDSFAQSLNELMESVENGLTETGQVMSAMADADLTRRVNGDYKGAFDRLKQDTNAMAERFADILGQLRTTSRSLKSATGEILAGANDLSERTTKQAATIEETSAAMEQLSQTVVDNAKKAEEAADRTEAASRMAEEGGTAMKNATSAMERITASSDKISNIIGMIDDIAFQTNLLALNASVEAARAGEAGQGFAVVAVEVRRLAQSAADASSEVKTLIEQSSSEVGDGSSLVNAAAEKLEEMLQAVQENSTLMQAISSASRESSSSIEEVTTAVRQLDDMTQRNAALVEETNAAIEQTESQAADLDRIVEIFKVDESATAQLPKAAAGAPAAEAPARPQKEQRASPAAKKTYLSQGNAAIDSDWAEF